MTLCEIPLTQILPAVTQLRPVRQDEIEYLEMVDSIRANGILNSIAVRPHPSREGLYEVIDGMWRLTASQELHRHDIPCIVLEDVHSNAQVLELQIQANAVSYETRPIEFAHQMRRLMVIREQAGAPVTLKQLGASVGKSNTWVSQRLNLLKLHKDLQEEIRVGNMGLGKGTALARIKTHKYQLELWQEHKDKNTRDFELEIGRFLQNIYATLDQNKADEYAKTTLRPRLQTMDSLLIELDRLEEISQIIVTRGLTSAIEGAKLTLEWVLNLHEEGRAKQVIEKRFQLSQDERRDIIGRQRYEELKTIRELEELREQRNERSRENF